MTMTNHACEITNLLYRYAEIVDSGKLEELATLFAEAKFKIFGSDELQDPASTIAMLKGVVKIYACGTPRTKHVVTNPIIEINEVAGTATCRAYYTVLQATDGVPLQVIASGRYNDKFKRFDNAWKFTYRDYTLFDLKGNLGGHLVGM